MREYGVSFKDDVGIDKYHLADEVERQPGLTLYYTEQLAMAKAARDKAESKLKYVEASRNLYYRNRGDKVTEKALEAFVEVDEEYQQAQAEWNLARETQYTLEAAVETVRDKSQMLRVEKDLYISGYFADPSKPSRNPAFPKQDDAL